jgi:protein-L-isoaspartate O-methyltransferase
MLEDLDVREGHSVLEIGTGTGYNAALLCARLGDSNVTTIDIDPELVDSARHRLAAHGYHPHVLAGDGEQGVSSNAPYDRIIATCAIDSIPPAWIAQTRIGGVILANLRGNLMRGAQARLTVADDDAASGPFLPGYGSFMAMRHDPNAPFDYSVTVDKDTSAPVGGTTDLDPTTLSSDMSWASPRSICRRPSPIPKPGSTVSREPRSPHRTAPGPSSHHAGRAATAVGDPRKRQPPMGRPRSAAVGSLRTHGCRRPTRDLAR